MLHIDGTLEQHLRISAVVRANIDIHSGSGTDPLHGFSILKPSVAFQSSLMFSWKHIQHMPTPGLLGSSSVCLSGWHFISRSNPSVAIIEQHAVNKRVKDNLIFRNNLTPCFCHISLPNRNVRIHVRKTLPFAAFIDGGCSKDFL